MTTYTTQNIDAFTAATALSASDKFAVAQGDVVMRRALISQLVTYLTSGGGLGLGTMAYENSNAVSITGGTITGITDLAVADGGTGASTASGARTNLGLGTIATQDSSNVTITGGSITGITDLAVADGGTGSSTAAGARTNLGLGSISTQDASNVTITGGSITGITDLAVADGGTGASTASAARTNLGLGTIATQAASAVAITGGTITNVPDVDLTENITAIASATTTDIGAATTAKIAITGVVTITSFGTVTHQKRYIIFAGILTLTFNATSMILPGGINIVTAAGDHAIATSDGAGNWTIRHYQRYSGKPLTGPAAADITDSTAAGRAILTGVVTLTQPGTAATLTISNNKTLTATNSLTLSGTDGTTQTFPATSSSIQDIGGLYKNFVLLTSSGTWTVPAGVTQILVTMMGAGGGGGGVAAATAAAAGGMSGTQITMILTVVPAAGMSYACGAAGAGGAAGNNPGVTGGDTTFDVYTAKGGLFGNGSASGNATANSGGALGALKPGITPTSTVTPINIANANGQAGATTLGGFGGPSVFGAGGASGVNSDGGAATGYGAGGGGASTTVTPARAGGTGTAGCIAIRY